MYQSRLDVFFHQITTFIKVCMLFVLGLQTLLLRDFTTIYWLKGLKPKNKGHTNNYECCNLTKKYISKVPFQVFMNWTLWLWSNDFKTHLKCYGSSRSTLIDFSCQLNWTGNRFKSGTWASVTLQMSLEIIRP